MPNEKGKLGGILRSIVKYGEYPACDKRMCYVAAAMWPFAAITAATCLHNDMREMFLLQQVKQDVIEAIRLVPFIGNTTYTAAALRLVHATAFQPQHGDRPGVQNIAVLVGDGNSNVHAELTPVEAAVCRINGIRMIVAVVFDDQTDVSELSTIASRPLSENMFMGTPEMLFYNITELLIISTCNVTGRLGLLVFHRMYTYQQLSLIDLCYGIVL